MPRRLPSLSALRAFEAVVRLGSAKRAAMELSVTPTAISHRIRHLEAQLETRLFVRRPRQLQPTAQGRALGQALGDALDDIAAAVERLRVPGRRALTLSTTPAVAARWLLPQIPRLADVRPPLDLHLQVSHVPVPLGVGGADAAIRYGSGQWPGLVAHPLFRNVYAPVCSPSLGLASAGQLPGCTLLHFAPRGAVSMPVEWTGWQRIARVPGLQATAGPVFSDETHVISAALAGQGVGLMSLSLVADELAHGTLVQPFGPVMAGADFHLVYPERSADDPALMQLRDWILGLVPPGG